MSGDATNTNQDVLDQLSAYLDGELDAAESERVEQLLASDPQARDELVRLQRAWELLDRLPPSEVEASFTQTTVDMIAVAAADTAEPMPAASLPWRRWLLAGGGLVAAGLLGFVSVAALRPDPNAALLEDLPVIENLEIYRQADSIEFLRALKQENLFPPESASHVP